MTQTEYDVEEALALLMIESEDDRAARSAVAGAADYGTRLIVRTHTTRRVDFTAMVSREMAIASTDLLYCVK